MLQLDQGLHINSAMLYVRFLFPHDVIEALSWSPECLITVRYQAR